MNQIDGTGMIHDSMTDAVNHSGSIPTTTTGKCQAYITQAATTTSRACVDDQLNLVFQQEKHNVLPLNATPDQIREALYRVNVVRLETAIRHGSLIAEAGNFAAVACWSPPDPPSTPLTEHDLQSIADEGRLHFKDFLTKIERAREQHLYPLYGHRCWQLTLMARDPSRPYLPGAVRAVIDPFIARARTEGVPIWLCAGSEHARDIYAHFGFRVVDTLFVAGIVPVWCMILEPSSGRS